MADRWDPEAFQAWSRIVRDFCITFVGAFMLVWQTVFAEEPSALIIGAGLGALGLPPVLRIDQLVKRNDEETKETKEDRWSHLP